jgi:hypothetical protein
MGFGTLEIKEPIEGSVRTVDRELARYKLDLVGVQAMNVGPCHHGMARPQVADGGTASDMEGSCE